MRNTITTVIHSDTIEVAGLHYNRAFINGQHEPLFETIERTLTTIGLAYNVTSLGSINTDMSLEVTYNEAVKNRYVCDGMEYRFLNDTGELLDNYGTLVAKFVAPNVYFETFYMYDIESGQTMIEGHQNSLPKDIGRLLVEQYTAFNM